MLLPKNEMIGNQRKVHIKYMYVVKLILYDEY